MAMDINSLLIEKQRSMFVGREREITLLKKALSDEHWQILHFHGSGGIGKTTLFRIFAQAIGPSRCFYFDGHIGFQRPNDFLNKVLLALQERDPNESEEHNNLIDRLNRYAEQKQGIVLLFDTFEQWNAIENWLRSEWFSSLSPFVKICMAGRHKLEGQWLRDGWNLFMQNIELQPLTSSEVRKYALTRGIENRHVVDSLHRFSRGIPLAMSMSCEIIIRNGRTSFLDLPKQQQLIGYLAHELTKDLEDSSMKLYTEAASIVWRFDQELLESILQTKIPSERFREFCRLPYVMRQEGNWCLHDSVRQWTFNDFRSRMPQTFSDYRKHALEVLRERERNNPANKAKLAFEKIYLHESDFVRDFCFQWDDSLVLHECTEGDLEQIQSLYATYLQHQSNYIPGEAHLESLIQPLYNAHPAAFIGMWKEDRLIAFCSCIPLTEQTVQIFRSNPITTPVTARYDPNQRQSLVCIAGLAIDLESEISGSIARAMAKIIDRDAVILDLISMPNWIPLLPLLGFERAPWADSATTKGIEYLGYQLDLRTEDLPSRIDRMFSAPNAQPAVESDNQTEAAAPENITKLALEDAVKLVQRALKHYSKLPLHVEITDSLRPLMTSQSSESENDLFGHRLQGEIMQILRTFASGTEEERTYYNILHTAYIQRIGTHETVAEYLNLSVPTYYRYLRAAVRKLAYEFIKPTS